MKNRILTGWTIPRILYAFIGIMVMVQGYTEHQYWGMAFGAYFASMGIFNFGCASGACYGGNCYTQEQPVKAKSNIENVEFEEIKKQ